MYTNELQTPETLQYIMKEEQFVVPAILYIHLIIELSWQGSKWSEH